MNKKGLLAGIDAGDNEPQATNHYDKPIFDIIEVMFEFAKGEFESLELSEQIEQFIKQYKETYTGTSSVPKGVVYNLMMVMRILSFHQPINPNRKIPEAVKIVKKTISDLTERQKGQKKSSATKLKVKEECFEIYKIIEDKSSKYIPQIISEIIKEYNKRHPELTAFPREDDTVKKWIEEWRK